MKLSIYSLKKVLYSGDAELINCKTKSGEITILDHHRPLLSALAPGVIKIVDKNKKEEYITASSGFVEIKNNVGRILVNE
jgi:ATP synthase F1 epsilon subunit